MASGTFEPEETNLILRLMNKTDTFVDVGANVGFYACLARRHGKRVVAVEPLADNLEYLLGNLMANGWEDVEVFPLGLASRPRVATLFGAATGASLVSGWAGASPLLKRHIALSTLDTVLATHDPGSRLLIKIDVEGSELEVLAGAGATLKRVPPPLWVVEINLTENHPGGFNTNFQTVFERFWSHGYRVWQVELRPTEVTAADVRQWTSDPATGPAGGNFLFAKTGGLPWD
jgi:FkbM family methyltransferase